MKTVKFFTLGCKVNQYDTQFIREQFLRSGFKEVNNGWSADVYVINTCTVTHKADRDSLSLIRKAKRENPKGEIIVTGCLTELDSEKIKKINLESVIIKNNEKPRILERLFSSDIQSSNGSDMQTVNIISYFAGHSRAFLKIQDGCNNFCSYCKVPLVRSVLYSKPIEEVVKEAQSLVRSGYREIVICGICLGLYGKGSVSSVELVDVIERLENIDGLYRLRLSSIEPQHLTDRLIEKVAHSKKICRHLHIPLQSGDDGILKKMNRKYTSQDYRNLITKLKGCIPQIAITTDVMVGFPGETPQAFENTINLVKEILPLRVHVFTYSKRPGTLAAGFNQSLNQKELKERILYLRKIAQSCSFKFKKQFLGKEMEVLLEGDCKAHPEFLEGLTDNYIKVLVKDSSASKGQIIKVRLNQIWQDYVLAEANYTTTSTSEMRDES
ncbi:MAG: tRNA (N(6)-L-threonylcarbamoyladenosine(37)-C(2))-methylthiotransferase MtaB [Candidatus Omnitrophica bacterium]|nr:tRNA (N(6)-L-threonylcarbamoyladenosine(37)-C(2))-methylthiotransferase MtaB [Candidatus Omnitrophota bacterium]